MALKRLERMAAKVDVTQPQAQTDLARWDAETFATWARRNAKTPAARDPLRLAIQAVWAAERRCLAAHAPLLCQSSGGSLERCWTPRGAPGTHGGRGPS